MWKNFVNPKHKKAIVFDLDGVICTPGRSKDTFERYGLAKPVSEIINSMWQLKEHGYHIIIHTARRMVTHDDNVADVIKDVGEITENWLRKHHVPYDELVFGKPYSEHYYVDDKAMNLEQYDEWIKNEKFRIW